MERIFFVFVQAAHKGDKEVSPVIEGKESGIILEMTVAKLGFYFLIPNN